MALSMDEQRILAEIEQHLARAEPRLAARLSGFGQTRPVWPARASRSHVVTAIALAIVVTAVSLVIYALVAMRAQQSSGNGRSSGAARAPAMIPQASASPQRSSGASITAAP